MPTTNTSYYKRVRRDGKTVTIDTRTGKVVTREKRKKDFQEDVARVDQRRKESRLKIRKSLKRNLIDRFTYSDEFDKTKGRVNPISKLLGKPAKGRYKTTLESDKEYEKEVRNRDTGKDDAEMTPKQQKRALKISKKRNLTDLKVNKGTSEKESSDKKKKKKSSSGGREKAIRRAYGNISDKRVKQLLGRAATQRELEES